MLAIERAGIDAEKYHAFEIDDDAIGVSQSHFPQIIRHGDVLTADFAEFSHCDLILAGSPCQSFSAAGNQKGFDDPRGQLFYKVYEAIQTIKPKYFLFENVVMRKDEQKIISNLLGVEPIMINSSLVSAQNRKRLYWTNIPGVVQPEDKGILLEDIVLEDALVDRDKSLAIIATTGRKTLEEYYQKSKGQNAIMLSNIYGGFGETKPRVHVGKSVTVRAGGGGGHIPSLIINDKVIEIDWESLKKATRKILPIECERLQTMPDNYTATTNLSNTRRYKLIGNGWTVDAIAHILSFIPKG